MRIPIPARLLALSLLALISSWAHAQSIIIPAHTFTSQINFAGTNVNVTITEPAQTITLPAMPLPAGLSFSKGVLAVDGSIAATSVDLTSGTVIPVSSSGLYLLQMVGGFLHPVPYVPYTPTTGVSITSVTPPAR